MCLDKIAVSMFVEVLYTEKCLPPASPLPSPPRKHLLHLVHWKNRSIAGWFVSTFWILWRLCKVIELILENRISEIPRRYFLLLSSWRLSFSFVQYLWPKSSQQTSAQQASTQHSRFAPSSLGRRVLTVAQGGEVDFAAYVWSLHHSGIGEDEIFGNRLTQNKQTLEHIFQVIRWICFAAS